MSEATPSLLDTVRQSCAWVAANADHVHLAGDAAAYALSLLEEQGGSEPTWDTPTHYQGAEDDTAAFVITLDAINFGSGYFPHLEKRPGRSGYFTVATALTELFEREGPLGAGRLARMTAEETARIFGQSPGDPVRDELMTLFARAWRELGEFLTQGYGGSFRKLLEAAGGSAEALAGLLARMPSFRDEARYRGRRVLLLKRAQITPSDLALALEGKGLGSFTDLERLTIFADNLVPHVLRLDGILEYSEPLAGRLERGELIPAGSAEEVEIRAVALHAVEVMVEELRAHGVPGSARQLDVLLWNRGQASRYRGGSKHRTRTVFY